jgi:flagellar protein FlaG
MSQVSNSIALGGIRVEPKASPQESAPAVQGKAAEKSPPIRLATQEIPKSNLQFDPKRAAVQLAEAIDRLNKQMEATKRGLGFTVDDRLNLTVVTVRDTNTGEVVRQIPSDVVIRVAHHMEDLKGILFHNKA